MASRAPSKASTRPDQRTSGPDARACALVVLGRLRSQGGFSNRRLAQAFEARPTLSRADRGFVTHLVYGVLRQRNYLDVLIDRCATRPGGLKAKLRDLLRLAVLELTELDKPLAIVNSEARRLSKTIDRTGRLQGVVTAILQRCQRERTMIDSQLQAAVARTQLTQRFSLPEWLAERWLAELGEARALKRAAALLRPPALEIRVDTSRVDLNRVQTQLQADQTGARMEAFDDGTAGLRLHGAGDIFNHKLHQSGMISVQSRGSQAASIALDPKPGERVLDACAGMGIKTMHLAELMDRTGQITAIEPEEARFAGLAEHAQRCQLDDSALQLETLQGDLRTILPADARFDRVLVDAPCSGLGNLARHPELRWQAQPDAIAAHAALQRSLLKAGLAHTRQGGRLVYAVCSLEPEECQGVAAQVGELAGGRKVTLEAEERFTPEDHGCDGFYLAQFRVDS